MCHIYNIARSVASCCIYIFVIARLSLNISPSSATPFVLSSKVLLTFSRIDSKPVGEKFFCLFQRMLFCKVEVQRANIR